MIPAEYDHRSWTQVYESTLTPEQKRIMDTRRGDMYDPEVRIINIILYGAKVAWENSQNPHTKQEEK